jgi:hypothetical protein
MERNWNDDIDAIVDVDEMMIDYDVELGQSQHCHDWLLVSEQQIEMKKM